MTQQKPRRLSRAMRLVLLRMALRTELQLRKERVAQERDQLSCFLKRQAG